MIFQGCQSKSKELSLEEKVCPQCGNIIELFSVDTEVACDRCGFVAFNDKLSCVQWCKYARRCVGDEMYERMQETAKRNKTSKSTMIDAASASEGGNDEKKNHTDQ